MLLTSTDGETWTEPPADPGDRNLWQVTDLADGLLATALGWFMWTSPDGLAWHQAGLADFSGTSVNLVSDGEASQR